MEVPGNILNHAFGSKSLHQQFFLKDFWAINLKLNFLK